jgi:group I intron endonuclease
MLLIKQEEIKMINLYKLSYNNLVYIGKTKLSLQERFRQHLREAKSSTKPLYKAMREHGPENFRIELLEELKLGENARIREIYYIKQFGNLNLIGRSSRTRVNNVINELRIAIDRAEQVLEALELLNEV